MSEFYRSSPGVNRFFDAVTDVNRYQTTSYRVVEFSWKGGRYRLVSTGDLYQLNYCGVPVLVQPFKTSNKGYVYAVVNITEQNSGYYMHGRKQYHLKDLVWSAFGDHHVDRGWYVVCKDENIMNCKIENLEVRKRGVS